MSSIRYDAALAHYGELARLGQAFSSPVRVRLVDLLRQAPRSVDALSEQAGLPIANVSQHLKVLKAANVVDGERRGQRVVYRLAGPDVDAFFLLFRAFAEERLPELGRLRDEVQGGAEQIARAELDRLLAEDAALVVDVRPALEFEAGHFEGAISIPLPELPHRIGELPKGKLVITTCRGPFCPMAIEAALMLQASGYRAAYIDLDASESDAADESPHAPETTSPGP